MNLAPLLADLRAEQEALDERVAYLADAAWDTPTPAEGWAVRDEISHLCFFDEQAALALVDPDAFRSGAKAVVALAIAGGDVQFGRGLEPGILLSRWRRGRAELLEAGAGAREGIRVPWYALPMSVPSFLTARLMETWAHGQDIADALGLEPVATDRLAHICHLGVAARGYAFAAHGLADPGGDLHVSVRLPSGSHFTAGPAEAPSAVTGEALDLALVVTRRRHRTDTALSATGPLGEAWLAVAQAFAGPPGSGRNPSRATSQEAP